MRAGEDPLLLKQNQIESRRSAFGPCSAAGGAGCPPSPAETSSSFTLPAPIIAVKVPRLPFRHYFAVLACFFRHIDRSRYLVLEPKSPEDAIPKSINNISIRSIL